ncbi:LysR family transcriptional regulator [Bordetella genomosp. 9]|uniref:LysR family transcriptional regulator n=1 Tax=Bordetella genomosp. 9 TaxID=1416803 RepID=A0A1W6Z143_9BORD|nr:LysR family transcriptional regulator [Bordetella genomosp. 9]ARP87038.1 LysR family transcriptional regulator [Bordetella genomosp. 9]ARP92694.1 LysR family transcriptional regulator [Bordetella genomosp. 9]
MKTTLDEMQTFIAVVDTGSITAASAQLGQTVSAISRALGRLERKLETTLLQRTTRRLALTEEGKVFLAEARRIVESVDAMEEQMAVRRQRPAGLLRVNAASPFMLHVIVPLVGDFRARYPEISLELHTSDQIIDLLEQRTDIAIRIGPLRDSTLHARPLGSNALRILASPAYLAERGKPRTPADLARHSLLGFTQPDSLNQWPLRHASGESMAIQPTLAASSGETLRQLALAGQGLVCLADFMTVEDRRRGDLVQVLTRHTVDVRQPVHAVYYRNTQLASRIACFLDYVAERMQPARA